MFVSRLGAICKEHGHGIVIWLAVAAGLYLTIGLWSLIVLGVLTAIFLTVMVLRDRSPF